MRGPAQGPPSGKRPAGWRRGLPGWGGCACTSSVDDTSWGHGCPAPTREQHLTATFTPKPPGTGQSGGGPGPTSSCWGFTRRPGGNPSSHTQAEADTTWSEARVSVTLLCYTLTAFFPSIA